MIIVLMINILVRINARTIQKFSESRIIQNSDFILNSETNNTGDYLDREILRRLIRDHQYFNRWGNKLDQIRRAHKIYEILRKRPIIMHELLLKHYLKLGNYSMAERILVGLRRQHKKIKQQNLN